MRAVAEPHEAAGPLRGHCHPGGREKRASAAHQLTAQQHPGVPSPCSRGTRTRRDDGRPRCHGHQQLCELHRVWESGIREMLTKHGPAMCHPYLLRDAYVAHNLRDEAIFGLARESLKRMRDADAARHGRWRKPPNNAGCAPKHAGPSKRRSLRLSCVQMRLPWSSGLAGLSVAQTIPVRPTAIDIKRRPRCAQPSTQRWQRRRTRLVPSPWRTPLRLTSSKKATRPSPRASWTNGTPSGVAPLLAIWCRLTDGRFAGSASSSPWQTRNSFSVRRLPWASRSRSASCERQFWPPGPRCGRVGDSA